MLGKNLQALDQTWVLETIKFLYPLPMALRSISNLPIQIILGFCRMDFIPTFPNRDQAMFPARPLKLLDCAFQPEGVAAELMIVEGDSASSSVGAARDERFQAVLPLQGKPLNAWKASRTRVAANPFYQAIIDAIGAGWDESFAIERVRYERIVLIFDPDADGIHCSMMSLVLGSQADNRCVGCRVGGLQHTHTLLHDGSHLTQHLRSCRSVDGSDFSVYGRDFL